MAGQFISISRQVGSGVDFLYSADGLTWAFTTRRCR